MSYEVLAQKWRPQNFADVVGQEHVTTTLRNQILSERIGHAYLFWGPRGTGKTTVARILAKAVNCPNRIRETEFDKRPVAEPCNACEFCDNIAQGKSFDVIEMDAASNRGIDTIRDMRENVKLAPAACTYKIYIIDEAHMLSTEAFNALLKTLEEPPRHVIFIMATTEHAKIPKTIASRCQDFDFRHLEDQKIVSRLALIAEKEDISADLDVLMLITRQSEGCLRDAENLLERLVSSAGKNLTTASVEQTLGLSSSSLLQKLAGAIVQRNLADGLTTLNKLAKQGTELTQCLHQLIIYFRDLRLLAIDKNLGELIQSPKSELPELRTHAELMSVNRLSRIIRILMRTNRDIKEYGYAKLQLENGLIELNSLEEGIHLQELVNKLSELEQKLDVAPAPDMKMHAEMRPDDVAFEQEILCRETLTPPDISQRQEQPKTASLESTPSNLDESLHVQPTTVSRNLSAINTFWEEVKSKLPPRMRLGLLSGAIPYVNGDSHVKIACPLGYLSMANDEQKRKIAATISEIVGKSVQVELIELENHLLTETSTEAEAEKELKTPLARQIEAEADPQLKTVLQLFNATILKTE